ncbi:MAG: capsular polysaccharide biosynthesis protein CapF [Methylococcales bacterium]
MRVLVTGADGFLGKNLCLRLKELGMIEVLSISRESSEKELKSALGQADFIFHLAGVNRPQDPSEFLTGNTKVTQTLCDSLANLNRPVPIVYTSSSQATLDNAYGKSKLAAEEALSAYSKKCNAKVFIYRLPNIFGKWCKPNYNSAVATFCHNIARGLPIKINDPAAEIQLVYVDDVISSFISLILVTNPQGGFQEVSPIYTVSVGEIAAQIQAFKNSRSTLVTERVGTGFVRALYATYVSYLPIDEFSYELPKYGDARGEFVEMLKTPDAGQFSFFTAHPGITRGGHYHHTKTEKFLVIRGKARFGFRQINTGEKYELVTDGAKPEIVETVPGWTHDITNIGEEEMIVMLWANEIFDREKPDTIAEMV